MSAARRSAVVLGAAGGIGSATVRVLVRKGWSVVGVDRAPQPPDLEPDVLGHVSWIEGDVRDGRVRACALDRAAERGTLRGLVTAVLAESRGPLEELPEEDVAAVLDTQAVAAWRWSAAMVRRGVPPDGASVVHVSSVHADRAAPGMAAYAMAKASLGALARASALEWGPLGVRCNVVMPGFVPVARNAHRWSAPSAAQALRAHHPLGRLVSPEDVAAVVSFLLSAESRAVTGVCLPVDGGMLSMLPGWA